MATRRRTSASQFTIGLVVADLVGTGLTSIAYGVADPWTLFVTPIIAPFIWGAGLLLLATPTWCLMTRLGVRSLSAAILLGISLCTSVSVAFAAIFKPAEVTLISAIASTIWPILGLAAAGAASALAGWSVAYRPMPLLGDDSVDEVFG